MAATLGVSLFILIALIAGAAILAFYSENIKKFIGALLYSFIVSLLLYWFIGFPFGLPQWTWGLLFVVVIIVKLWADTRESYTSVVVNAS